MKVAILTRSERLHTARRLLDACHKKGLPPLHISWESCAIRLSDKGVRVRWDNKAFPKVDLVIPHLGVADFDHGLGVLQALEAQKIRSLVPAQAFETASNPLKATLALARRKCPLPPSSVAATPAKVLREAAKLAADELWVVPASGKNTNLCRAPAFVCGSKDGLRATLDAARCLSDVSILQAGPTPQKGDQLLRVFVVGGRSVATFQLTGDHWPEAPLLAPASQLQLSPHPGDPEVNRVAIQSAKAIHAQNYASVDVFKSRQIGLRVMGVRCAPSVRDAEIIGQLDLCALVAQAAKDVMKQ